MKESVNIHRFRDGFVEAGRKDSFSYEGLGLLFEYFEELEKDMGGEEIEYDPIAICGEYNEYGNFEEFKKDYRNEYENIDDIRKYTDVVSENDDPDELLIIRLF